MRIQEVAHKADVTPDALRFYEKCGLLGERHVSRLANGYRVYTEAALVRLRLVKLARQMGFSLADIAATIGRWEGGGVSDGEKAAIYDLQLRKVEAQLAELTRLRAYLLEKRSQLDGV